jgi:hypothetical protein
MFPLAGYNAGSSALWQWSPWLLGNSLVAWWDAEHSDLIAATGGAVSSWADAVQGIAAVQAIGAQMPLYGASAFNGRPGVTFDGVDDYLRAVGTSRGFPTGSAGGEVWILADELAPGSDGASRDFASLGAGTNNDSRRLNGTGGTGTFRGRMVVGTGASSVSHTNGLVDAFGRHVFRFVTTPTQEWVEVDGVSDTPTAVTPSTSADRVTLGAHATTSPVVFGKMVLAVAIFTLPLTAGQSAALFSNLTQRL